MIFFLFNWLVSFCFFPSLRRILSYLKGKRNARFFLAVSPFSSFRSAIVFRAPLSSIFLSFTPLLFIASFSPSLILLAASTILPSTSPYAVLLVSVRSAVQSCSKSRGLFLLVFLYLLSRLLDPVAFSSRKVLAGSRKGGQSRGRTKTDGRG